MSNEMDKRRKDLVLYEVHFFQEQLLELENETLELEKTLKQKKFRLEVMRKRLRQLKIRINSFLNQTTIVSENDIDGL